MTQAIISDPADALIAKLADVCGESEDAVREIVRLERKRLSCLARRPDRLEIAERLHIQFSTARNELDAIKRDGLLAWQARYSPAKVWATLHGLKRDGIRTISL